MIKTLMSCFLTHDVVIVQIVRVQCMARKCVYFCDQSVSMNGIDGFGKSDAVSAAFVYVSATNSRL